MDLTRFLIYFLGGATFVLSGYVVINHIRLWRKCGHHLLPLHVWIVSIAYNLLVVSVMTRVPEYGAPFIFSASGLLLGLYSLWVLGQYQHKRKH